jgi:hypothetical protein
VTGEESGTEMTIMEFRGQTELALSREFADGSFVKVAVPSVHET